MRRPSRRWNRWPAQYVRGREGAARRQARREEGRGQAMAGALDYLAKHNILPPTFGPKTEADSLSQKAQVGQKSDPARLGGGFGALLACLRSETETRNRSRRPPAHRYPEHFIPPSPATGCWRIVRSMKYPLSAFGFRISFGSRPSDSGFGSPRSGFGADWKAALERGLREAEHGWPRRRSSTPHELSPRPRRSRPSSKPLCVAG